MLQVFNMLYVICDIILMQYRSLFLLTLLLLESWFRAKLFIFSIFVRIVDNIVQPDNRKIFSQTLSVTWLVWF